MTTDAPALPPRAPTPVQMRTFALLSATFVALTLAAVPWARELGTADPHVVVMYGSRSPSRTSAPRSMLGGALPRQRPHRAPASLSAPISSAPHGRRARGVLSRRAYEQPLVRRSPDGELALPRVALGAAALFFARAARRAPRAARSGARPALPGDYETGGPRRCLRLLLTRHSRASWYLWPRCVRRSAALTSRSRGARWGARRLA
jgi:hypothetical protein